MIDPDRDLRGATAVRAARSTRTRNEAPPSTESGTTHRFEAPATIRIGVRHDVPPRTRSAPRRPQPPPWRATPRPPRRAGPDSRRPRLPASSSPTPARRAAGPSEHRYGDHDGRQRDQHVAPSGPPSGVRGSTSRPRGGVSEFRCWTNVCTAVRNDATATPPRISPVDDRPPTRSPEAVRHADLATAPMNAAEGHGEGVRGRRHRRHRDRRAEPGSGRRSEQVRVGERIPEHPLVGRARCGQRCADERGHDHARQSQVPEDRGLLLGHAGRRVAERRQPSERIACGDCTGPTSSPATIERSSSPTPNASQRARRLTPRSPRHALDRSRDPAQEVHDPGPQRDAMSSSIEITSPAPPRRSGPPGTLRHRRRGLAAALRVGEEDQVGFAWMMYSAESCG